MTKKMHQKLGEMLLNLCVGIPVLIVLGIYVNQFLLDICVLYVMLIMCFLIAWVIYAPQSKKRRK